MVASAAAEKIMGREKIVKAMFANDHGFPGLCSGRVSGGEPEPLQVEILNVELVVGEGDALEIEPGVRLEILEAQDTPLFYRSLL